jgi:hypothetical protein
MKFVIKDCSYRPLTSPRLLHLETFIAAKNLQFKNILESDFYVLLFSMLMASGEIARKALTERDEFRYDQSFRLNKHHLNLIIALGFKKISYLDTTLKEIMVAELPKRTIDESTPEFFHWPSDGVVIRGTTSNQGTSSFNAIPRKDFYKQFSDRMGEMNHRRHWAITLLELDGPYLLVALAYLVHNCGALSYLRITRCGSIDAGHLDLLGRLVDRVKSLTIIDTKTSIAGGKSVFSQALERSTHLRVFEYDASNTPADYGLIQAAIANNVMHDLSFKVQDLKSDSLKLNKMNRKINIMCDIDAMPAGLGLDVYHSLKNFVKFYNRGWFVDESYFKSGLKRSASCQSTERTGPKRRQIIHDVPVS